jgi:transcriptional regulator with XRE-family HTH domain
MNHKMIGDYLADKRLKRNITQLELSRKLGYTSPQFISNWERGLSSPPLAIMGQLCDILKISKRDMADLLMKEYKNRVDGAFSKRKKAADLG